MLSAGPRVHEASIDDTRRLTEFATDTLRKHNSILSQGLCCENNVAPDLTRGNNFYRMYAGCQRAESMARCPTHFVSTVSSLLQF